MQAEMPRLFLARHGDTAWTESRQRTGRTDLPLNASGEDHARHLGDRLRRFSFAQVFTSPLQRASKTCALAGFGEVAEVDPDLLEWDYGRFEGKLTREVLKERPGWEMFRDGCPGGESPQDVAARAAYFKQAVHERLIEHKEYIAEHGDDMPTISGWKWGKSGGGPGSAKRDTAADNV